MCNTVQKQSQNFISKLYKYAKKNSEEQKGGERRKGEVILASKLKEPLYIE